MEDGEWVKEGGVCCGEELAEMICVGFGVEDGGEEQHSLKEFSLGFSDEAAVEKDMHICMMWWGLGLGRVRWLSSCTWARCGIVS
jgi:hypothetical protein